MIKSSGSTGNKKRWDFFSIGSDTKNPLVGGLNNKNQPSTIRATQSPDMLNLNSDDKGTYVKRKGQAYTSDVFAGSKINGIYEDYNGYMIVAAGTKLYKRQDSTLAAEIYSGLADNKVTMFNYNGLLYIKDGVKFLQYDGITVSDVVPYIPITSYLRKPDGSSSTALEDRNLLGAGFRNQFNGDSTSTVFHLSEKGLDVNAVIAVVDNVTINEGSGLTVDRANGTVTFSTAPSDAGELNKNNVEITAYKAYTGNKEKILNCTIVKEFANVMFMSSGNNIWYTSQIPNAISPSAIKADYFPTGREYMLGSDKVKRFETQYDKLIVFRENSLLLITKTDSAPTDRVEYPIQLLNDRVGCVASESVQLINNVPVFLSKNGVHLIYSTYITGEKNVVNISENIDGMYPDRPGLLQESNLEDAVSYDDGSKYWLCLNGVAYVLDYDISFDYRNPGAMCWYKYDNIDANCFYSGGYGCKSQAKLVNWITAKNDFGQPINAYWYSKLIDFDAPNFYKTISDIWLTTNSNANSSITINFLNGNGVKVKSVTIPKTKNTSFSWASFSWSNFTFQVQRYGKPQHVQYNLNNIVYFQIQLENNAVNEDLSIITLMIKYCLTRLVR